MAPDREVSIVGAGLTGRVLALALGDVSGARFTPRVLDVAPGPRPPDDIRTYAIAAGTRRMLTALGIWPRVAGEAQPVSAMDITDTRLAEVVRPILTSFEGEAGDGEPFVHFIDARALTAAVDERLGETGTELIWNSRLQELRLMDVAMALETSRGRFDSRLVVGADGARSAVRRLARLGNVGWPYRQSSIITIIAHEVPHDGRAVQHFLPEGPLALLPLPGNRSGIVWTVSAAEADRLVRLPGDAFTEELAAACGPERGDIEVLEAPRVYALELGIARRFVGDRVALVGDAAHRVHPLAGQGLNLGLRDVAALTEVLAEAVRRGEDFGSLTVLRRYERWRRFDTVQLAAATDGLNRLFSNDWAPLRTLRDIGLGLVGRAPRLTRTLISEASGEMGEIPRLLRGDAV